MLVEVFVVYSEKHENGPIMGGIHQPSDADATTTPSTASPAAAEPSELTPLAKAVVDADATDCPSRRANARLLLAEDLVGTDLQEARHVLEEAHVIDTMNGTVLLGLGSVLLRLGEVQAALGRLDEAHALLGGDCCGLYPQIAQCLKLLAEQAYLNGDLREAIRHVRRALSFVPADDVLHQILGWCFMERAELEAARYHIAMAIHLNDQNVEHWKKFATLMERMNNPVAKMNALDRIVQLQPDCADVTTVRAGHLMSMGRAAEAVEEARRALALDATHAGALNTLANTLKDLGFVEEAFMLHERCLAQQATHKFLYQNCIIDLNYVDHTKPHEVFFKTVGYMDRLAALFPNLTDDAYEFPIYPPDSDRPVRIGYLGADFHSHSVACFTLGFVTEVHKQYADRVEQYIYDNSPRQDWVTARFREAVDAYRICRTETSESIAKMIRADAVDILIEFPTHMADNRVEVFLARPAPVQVAMLGYPGTAGFDQCDLRITDAVVDPPDSTQLYSEGLVRLPETLWCYQSFYTNQIVGPPPVLENGFVTFGCFQTLAKVQDRCLEIWCRILKAVPSSKLLMKCKVLGDQQTHAVVLQRFLTRGVSADRLIFKGWMTGEQHMAAYNAVDITLDTFPYAGTTSTCDCLFMSTPALTLWKHGHHCHSVGRSLLKSVGIEELICASEDEYVTKAIELANDTARIRSYKLRIREQMLESRLTDRAAYTHLLVNTLEAIHKKYQAEARAMYPGAKRSPFRWRRQGARWRADVTSKGDVRFVEEEQPEGSTEVSTEEGSSVDRLREP